MTNGVIILNRLIGGGADEKVQFEQRPVLGDSESLADDLGRELPGRGKRQCKGPGASEARVDLAGQ